MHVSEPSRPWAPVNPRMGRSWSRTRPWATSRHRPPRQGPGRGHGRHRGCPDRAAGYPPLTWTGNNQRHWGWCSSPACSFCGPGSVATRAAAHPGPIAGAPASSLARQPDGDRGWLSAGDAVRTPAFDSGDSTASKASPSKALRFEELTVESLPELGGGGGVHGGSGWRRSCPGGRGTVGLPGDRAGMGVEAANGHPASGIHQSSDSQDQGY